MTRQPGESSMSTGHSRMLKKPGAFADEAKALRQTRTVSSRTPNASAIWPLVQPERVSKIARKKLARPALVHGYANPLNLLRFAELPKVLKMLPYGRIRATRSLLVTQRAGGSAPTP